MYQSTETRSVPSQSSKINIFAGIVNFFKLTLLTIFVKSFIMDNWRALIILVLTETINQIFPNPCVNKAVLMPSDM